MLFGYGAAPKGWSKPGWKTMTMQDVKQHLGDVKQVLNAINLSPIVAFDGGKIGGLNYHYDITTGDQYLNQISDRLVWNPNY
jgi:hypothetical protein